MLLKQQDNSLIISQNLNHSHSPILILHYVHIFCISNVLEPSIIIMDHSFSQELNGILLMPIIIPNDVFQRKLQSVANVNSFLCVYIKTDWVQTQIRSLSYDCMATTSTDCIVRKKWYTYKKAYVYFNKYYFESVKVLFHITIPWPQWRFLKSGGVKGIHWKTPLPVA